MRGRRPRPALRFERRYSKPSSSGVRRSTPPGPQTETHSSTAAKLAAIRVRVHPDRAADGAGDVDSELEPRQAPARDLRGGRGKPDAAAAQDVRPVALERGQVAVQLQDETRGRRSRRREGSIRSRRPRRNAPPPPPTRAARRARPQSPAARTARLCHRREPLSAGRAGSPPRISIMRPGPRPA